MVVNKNAIQQQDMAWRMAEELIDGYDEEFELEFEDQTLDRLGAQAAGALPDTYREDRRHYFRELFRLQGELVKLQDWVVRTGHKVVILFEGRDAAGKGVIEQEHVELRRQLGIEESFGGRMLDMGPGDVLPHGIQRQEQVLTIERMIFGDE